MQYKILDYKWKKIQITEELIQDYPSMTIATTAEFEHNENMDTFEQAVQTAMYEGWEPLGTPQFIDGWINGSTKRILQPMVYKEEIIINRETVPTVPKMAAAPSNASPRKQTYGQRNKKTGGAEKSTLLFRF